MAPPVLLIVVLAAAAAPVDADAHDAVDAANGANALDAANAVEAADRVDPVVVVGAHAGAAVGLPVAGAVGRVNVRWQPLPAFSVEPHVDVGVLLSPILQLLSVGAGAPVVFTDDQGPDRARPYLGVGPFVASGMAVVAGQKAAALKAVGAEGVFGFRWLHDGGDAQLQLSVFGGVSDQPTFAFAGGVVGTFGVDFDVF